MNVVKRLEKQKREILSKITALEDFRPGDTAPSYRRCGKKNCACAREGHPGHVQYLWTHKIKGKSASRTLHLGPEVQKYLEETDRYREFKQLCKELIEVNERLCDLRPVPVVENEAELTDLKKKLKKRFKQRPKKR